MWGPITPEQWLKTIANAAQWHQDFKQLDGITVNDRPVSGSIHEVRAKGKPVHGG